MLLSHEYRLRGITPYRSWGDFHHCTRLENEIANNMYEQAELDWLIYNEPLTYMNLVLSGEMETHRKGRPERNLQD